MKKIIIPTGHLVSSVFFRSFAFRIQGGACSVLNMERTAG